MQPEPKTEADLAAYEEKMKTADEKTRKKLRKPNAPRQPRQPSQLLQQTKQILV